MLPEPMMQEIAKRRCHVPGWNEVDVPERRQRNTPGVRNQVEASAIARSEVRRRRVRRGVRLRPTLTRGSPFVICKLERRRFTYLGNDRQFSGTVRGGGKVCQRWMQSGVEFFGQIVDRNMLRSDLVTATHCGCDRQHVIQQPTNLIAQNRRCPRRTHITCEQLFALCRDQMRPASLIGIMHDVRKQKLAQLVELFDNRRRIGLCRGD